MKRRMKLSRGRSRKMFSRGASKTHKRNVPAPRKFPMRGGIRL